MNSDFHILWNHDILQITKRKTGICYDKKNYFERDIMIRELLVKQLKTYEDEFKDFMDIKEFPTYQLCTKEVSTITADFKGFEAVASTSFQPQNNSHTLSVSTNIALSKYYIFHEFTHMLDSEMNVKGDKIRYAGLSGFTEYHASQVELMELLGANTVDEVLSFSMGTIITTIAGEKSVYQYVNEKHRHAIELFSRGNFPADLDTLKSAMGVLYNYFGLRSICEEYSVDYTEKIDNKVFLKFIPTQLFVTLNRLMHGWLNEGEIELSINIYLNIIFPLINEFKLA